MEITKLDDGKTEKMERFYSLQSGQYWRATRDIPEQGIASGLVLLIQSIRFVDDALHTIVLRSHPSLMGKSFPITTKEGDRTFTRYHSYGSHKFFIDDFLDRFEYEPDHERIRREEVEAVQATIGDLQQQLLEAQRDPAIMADVVDEGMRKAAEKEAAEKKSDPDDGAVLPTAVPAVSAAAASRELADVAVGSLEDALSTGITPEKIEQLKQAATREHQVATIKAGWITSKTEEIASTIKALTPYFEEQAAAALAKTEDIINYARRLTRGIETLDLYTLKDVTVTPIREGASASKSEPLTFVQKKLLMDEEAAVFLDVGEWFDFTKQELFFEALRDHDGLVDQIFPTPRCVVAMATTRRFIDYGDPWTNLAKEKMNREVFLLVRDGMNFHQVFSPVESHLGAHRLFPSQDDQKTPFRGIDGRAVKFEDVTYTDRLAAYEAQALHYKRFLILCCGLDHKMKLFGDFYDGPQDFDFVTLGFQERYCRFLHDDDGHRMFPAVERPSIEDWVAGHNAKMSSGSRVLFNWREVMDPDTAPGACSPDRFDRYRVDRRFSPENNIDQVVVYQSGASLMADIEVRGMSWRRGENRSFNCHVDVSAYARSKWAEQSEIAYLCLDSVDPDDLRWYIHNRGMRSNHLFYIRFFKTALMHVESERLAEADTRRRMADALVDGNIVDRESTGPLVEQAVIAWRAANRGKPLPVFEGERAPAGWTVLLDQMFMLAGGGQNRVGQIAEFVRDLGLKPLRVVLSGKSKLAVYATPSAMEQDDRLDPFAWVHRIGVNVGKRKVSETGRRWMVMPAVNSAETVLQEWDEAARWIGRKSSFPSPAAKATAFEETGNFASLLAKYGGSMSQEDLLDELDHLVAFRRKIGDGKWVLNPGLIIPFGIYRKKSWEAYYLCMSIDDAIVHLGRLAPDGELRQGVRKAYSRIYRNEASACERFDNSVRSDKVWIVSAVAVYGKVTRQGAYSSNTGLPVIPDAIDPLIDHRLTDWLGKVDEDRRYWLADGVCDADGSVQLDALAQNHRPDDYAPTKARTVSVTLKNGDEIHLVDISPLDLSCTEQNGQSSFAQIHKELGGDSMRSSSHEFMTRAGADRLLQKTASDLGRIVVPSAELPEMPQPEEGVERFYLVLQKSAGAGA